MSKKELENLVTIGQLKIEPASRAEYAGMEELARKRLIDAQNEDLDNDSRFGSPMAPLIGWRSLPCAARAIVRKIVLRSSRRSCIRWERIGRIFRPSSNRTTSEILPNIRAAPKSTRSCWTTCFDRRRLLNQRSKTRAPHRRLSQCELLHPQPVPHPSGQHRCGDAERPERVQRHRLDAGNGHVDRGILAADETARELLSHRGRERDAAAVAAERDQEIFRGLMHMRIMIWRDREPAVPAGVQFAPFTPGHSRSAYRMR